MLEPLPHRDVSRLDVTAEAVRVEQRTVIAILRQLKPDPLEPRTVTRKVQRERLVRVEIAGDELGQAGRTQKAAGNTPRKAATFKSNQRQSRPQRVTGGGVRVVWPGVEEEIRKAMP